MFYVYLLESVKSGEWYIGYTSNLRRRLVEHNQGLNISTRRYKPWNVIYYEACVNEKDAHRREGYLKTTQGHRMLKVRLKEYRYEKGRKI